MQLEYSPRKHAIVLVDTMGDLADLFAAADYIFCGGSLVDRGGYNIMEPARLGKAVYSGLHMKDFTDAAQLLRDSGGGFQVADGQELITLLRHHYNHPAKYDAAVSDQGDPLKELVLSKL
ncbi:hypothetical protein JWJ90_15455 [Desulfobulbus rhabdoformis]|uniref:3-deoxy-D-manno-octulosonic acid transferase n=1 Tax=Desulfobulbus rhabdoformis TaxID=34032 RepID=UPI0019625AC0|nr:hypothetical protein [Desulfobulbus rhabdoformis]MBM9615665.1 hypothetical protein [Desulfobulbus rhabdoformis]